MRPGTKVYLRITLGVVLLALFFFFFTCTFFYAWQGALAKAEGCLEFVRSNEPRCFRIGLLFWSSIVASVITGCTSFYLIATGVASAWIRSKIH